MTDLEVSMLHFESMVLCLESGVGLVELLKFSVSKAKGSGGLDVDVILNTREMPVESSPFKVIDREAGFRSGKVMHIFFIVRVMAK
jgi:hypothetical protein